MDIAAPAYAQIGNRRFSYASYEQVSKAYRATIDALDLGCSETPRCTIHDGAGNEIAFCAYNGRVFASVDPITARTTGKDYGAVLYEAWNSGARAL